MNKKDFVPIIGISTCIFANGVKLRIDQVNAKGACAVVDIAEDKPKILNHTRSIEKAWASVRYVAGIINFTERSLGAPETEQMPRLRKIWT